MSEAFVRPEMRTEFDTDQKAVQDADFRDYLQKLIGDAMEATGGN